MRDISTYLKRSKQLRFLSTAEHATRRQIFWVWWLGSWLTCEADDLETREGDRLVGLAGPPYDAGEMRDYAQLELYPQALD